MFTIFNDYRIGMKYCGEVVNGKEVVRLFDFVDLSQVQDPLSSVNILPLPKAEPAATPADGQLIDPIVPENFQA
jgi:hypothetical protein